MIRKRTQAEAEQFGFSPKADAETNALALQRAISEYEYISVTEPGIYDISGSIKLPSNTHLFFSQGVTLRRMPRKDGYPEGNLIINEGAFTGTFNENITVEGAHITVNGVESASTSSEVNTNSIKSASNIITGLRGHIAFLYVKHLQINNITINDLLSKDYGIQVSDFEDIIIENIHIEGKKDGVHFGPGKNFILRNGKFRTADDAIALNCADYSVSNPNFGSISEGLIENCVELPGSESDLFIRILVGTARNWKKGMEVYHSDAIRTKNGMYRVVMKPDNRKYISDTEPLFEENCKELDGILWIKTHRGYDTQNIGLEAGCSNIIFRNIRLKQPRDLAVLIYMNNDGYLHSFYPGSKIPTVKNIKFENIQILKSVKCFLSVETPAHNIETDEYLPININHVF